MEAQGRGFTRGHGKRASAPRTAAARLKEVFARAAVAADDGHEGLDKFCKAMRRGRMRAAVALQCDFAVLPGGQLGVPLRPEPFSVRQLKHSRLGGQPEEMDDDGRLRPHLPTTVAEHNG